MKRKLAACIFDLDGVLTDTAHYHFISWRRLGREIGYELTEEKNKLLKGVSRGGSLKLILEWAGLQMGLEERRRMMDRKNQWYLEEIEKVSEGDLFKGVTEFLDELENEGIKYSLGSGSKNARKILNKIGLAERFKWVVDGNDIKRGKPDPELFIKAADLMNVRRSETVVFEDSTAGLSAALKGGFLAVGFGDDPELSELAHFTLRSWEGFGLCNLLDGLPSL
ncbi:MAG: beta-phosphoglucomutase [Saprospirales bacterium]|nr:MAG: beta-phosphoglucomutase [Saprospirales bacterium]